MDKYDGALAGVRAPAGNERESALSVAHSSRFEEVLCGEEGSVLRAHLDWDGSRRWDAVPPELVNAVQRRVVSQSQMSGMLLDTARNGSFGSAIRDSIQSFIASNQRRPVVLDIGAGTGLLSLLSAESGAEAVVGCEQWAVMADVATTVVSANPQWASKITILPRHSSDLTRADIPSGGIDIVVSEILDSSLLGEGAIPALRDAFSRLQSAPSLLPAVHVPHAAVLYGQLVHCPLFTQWHATSATDLLHRADGVSVPLRRTDWSSTGTCAAASPAIPVHAIALPDCSPVTLPFKMFDVEFSAKGLEQWAAAVDAPVIIRPAALLHAPSTSSPSQPSAANGLLLWWNCAVGLGAGVQYGTSPAAVSQQGWQDHWVQCVIPLPAPVTSGIVAAAAAVAPTPDSLARAADGERAPGFTVAVSLGDLGVHVVVGPGNDCTVWTSKRKHKLAIKSGAAPAASNSTALYMEPELCTCGLHRSTSYERRWALSSSSWGGAFARAVDAVLGAALAGSSSAADCAVLTLGEGALCAVAAVSGAAVAAASLSASSSCVSVVAIEFSEVGAVQSRAVLEAACPPAVHASTLELNPFEPFADVLEEALLADALESGADPEDAIAAAAASGEDEDVEESVPPAASGDDAMDAVEHPPHTASSSSRLFDVLLLEPYFLSLQHVPLVAMVHAFTLRNAVSHYLRPAAPVMPLRARVMVQAVSLQYLQDKHGPVGRVCGFSHDPFDAMVKGWDEHVYSFPLWQYPNTLCVSRAMPILELDFTTPVPDSADRDALLRGSVTLQPAAPPLTTLFPSSASAGPPVDAGALPLVNAIVCWVDWDLTPGISVTTGPACFPDGGWRQHVKFLANPVPLAAVAGGIQVAVSLAGVLSNGAISITCSSSY